MRLKLAADLLHSRDDARVAELLVEPAQVVDRLAVGRLNEGNGAQRIVRSVHRVLLARLAYADVGAPDDDGDVETLRRPVDHGDEAILFRGFADDERVACLDEKRELLDCRVVRRTASRHPAKGYHDTGDNRTLGIPERMVATAPPRRRYTCR